MAPTSDFALPPKALATSTSRIGERTLLNDGPGLAGTTRDRGGSHAGRRVRELALEAHCLRHEPPGSTTVDRTSREFPIYGSRP